MPDITPNLGLKKPLGNETVSRAAYNENLDIIDENTVKKGDGVGELSGGNITDRPSPGIVGRYYFAQDTGEIYLDIGTSWILAAAGRVDFDNLQQQVNAHLADFAKYAFGNRPYTATYTELYIDTENGNDNNDGLTQNTPIKTSNKLLTLIPVFLNLDLTIKIIGNFTGALYLGSMLNSHTGRNRKITVEGVTQNKANHLISSGIRVSNVSAKLEIKNLTVGDNAIALYNCPYFHISNVETNLNYSGTGALSLESSQGIIQNSQINNPSGPCILANIFSKVLSINNTGSGSYGLRALNGSEIIKEDAQPTGTYANENVNSGGVIR